MALNARSFAGFRAKGGVHDLKSAQASGVALKSPMNTGKTLFAQLMEFLPALVQFGGLPIFQRSDGLKAGRWLGS